jgi:hypothetical protein
LAVPGTSITVEAASLATQFVAEVEKFNGYPYVYGATGPNAFDCSGLVQYALTQLGVTGVPRTAAEQWGWVTRIKQSQLQPGDLVFAYFPGDDAYPGHVGIYTGDGQVLSAQDPALGVGYASLSSWSGNIVGYGSVPGAGNVSSTAPTASTSTPPASTSSTGTTTADTQQTQSLTSQAGDTVAAAGTLLHGAAESMNFFWEFFQPGQAWRLAFGAGAIVLGYAGLRTWGVVPRPGSGA